MHSFELIQTFLGWCSVINIGLLAFSALIVILFREQISELHAKIFHLNKEDVFRAYFQYLAQFKILIIVLNIVPYFALSIMH
jgi:hypothetical protein